MRNDLDLGYDSVIDNKLIHHNINHIECNRNTTNEKKLINDISKLGKIDMIIFNKLWTRTGIALWLIAYL